MPFCSRGCSVIHRAKSCRRVIGTQPVFGLIAHGKDPGWAWLLMKAGVDVKDVDVHDRGADVPGC